MTQLMQDAGKQVECPMCGRVFNIFDTQKNRAQVCPIVPSHLPDFARMAEIEMEKAKNTKSSTPRPY
jgi:ribosomal protein L34E